MEVIFLFSFILFIFSFILKKKKKLLGTIGEKSCALPDGLFNSLLKVFYFILFLFNSFCDPLPLLPLTKKKLCAGKTTPDISTYALNALFSNILQKKTPEDSISSIDTGKHTLNIKRNTKIKRKKGKKSLKQQIFWINPFFFFFLNFNSYFGE